MITPAPVAPWRLLLVGAMFVALYLVLAWVDDEVSADPWLLAAAVAGGAVAGAVVARLAKPRPARPRPDPSKAVIRSTLAGLTGTALILAQLLSPEGISWMTLGGVALMVGGATHGWLTRTLR